MEKNATADYDDANFQGDENTSFLNRSYVKEKAKKNGMKYLLLANLFVFTMSALTLICAIYMQHSKGTYVAAGLMDEFGIFSPAMHVVEYEQQHFKLAAPINSSDFVGKAPAVENAWKDIASIPDQMVSMEDFPALQKPADSLKVTDQRTGETGYQVGLGVFHQLQCLNILRLATYPENVSKVEGSTERAILDECIEVLRMTLQCQADVSVFTYHSVPGQKDAFPDFESQHVCRNFDKIKQWANDNAMN
ncbi:hypothetical protein P280DRAFT_402383 [Massarina eburnea CBS 473.64]|uniref:Uncharacterized protein n=1 Tax=Massarina eburnea CBS 473.64 TaxID=1395130 RepID=A0A6A6RVI9_9PLEO|nr:hypothetical protein P280DRAFT_402383 [Massarina eburnea CBS 473.64]